LPINALVVDNEGRVGIGTTSPQAKLHIAGTAGTDGIMFPDGSLQTQAGWMLGGNSGTNPGTSFLGTTDDQALVLKVNNRQTMRYQYAENTVSPGSEFRSANVLGGSDINSIGAGVVGATVAGGGKDFFSGTDGPNRMTGHFGTIGGGLSNTAGGRDGATVGGGAVNTASGDFATVGGGNVNTASGFLATVGGGTANTASGNFAIVPGGSSNRASAQHSFAAGKRAKADHDGAFVWADGQEFDFVSTFPDQFLIRAAGGVGIGTASPTNRLSVNGSADFSSNVGIGTPNPANRLSVNGSADFTGSVGVGTASPAQRLHVSNGSSGGVSQSTAELLVEDNSSCYVNIMAPNASERGVSFGSPADAVHGGIYYTNAGGLNLRTGGNLGRMIIDANGDVGIGVTGSNDARLHVQESGRVAKFDRFGSDGEIVAFARDDGVIGTISNAGGVVSYNAFTGSHYAWSTANVAAGALVSMTGENRRFGDRPDAEVVYGIQETARPNDPACLGVHLGPMESTRELGPENPRLVAAVGNGDLCVVDSGGGDIAPGDYLISSSVPGCAMKDDPARFPVGYVVARAAERVKWDGVPVDGTDMLRRRRISVFFENFVRNNTADRLAAEVQKLRETLELQQREIEAMRSLLSGQRSVASRDGS